MAAPVTGTPSLTNSILSSKIPATLVIATPLASTVNVKVLNSGTGATPAGAKVTVSLFLRLAGTSGDFDIFLGSKSQAFAKLKAGTGSQTVTVPVTVPSTLAVGTYSLIAKVAAVGFTPDADADAVSATPIQVQQALIGLTNSLASTTLPASFSVAATSTANASVHIVNNGNVTTGKTAKVSVTVALRPTAGGADILLGSKSAQSFGNIKPGSFKNIPISLKPPTTLATGTYTLIITVTPANFTPDSNNIVTGTTGAFTVTPPPPPGANPLGSLGNVITMTTLVDNETTGLGPLGSSVLQHWNFTDNLGHTGELFLTQNFGVLAVAADATINFFPNGGLGTGTVVLNGGNITDAFAVGTQLTFGTTGSISYSNDTYTHKGKGKVARTN
jgi:hypothetical protein